MWIFTANRSFPLPLLSYSHALLLLYYKFLSSLFFLASPFSSVISFRFQLHGSVQTSRSRVRTTRESQTAECTISPIILTIGLDLENYNQCCNASTTGIIYIMTCEGTDNKHNPLPRLDRPCILLCISWVTHFLPAWLITALGLLELSSLAIV